MSDQHAPCGDGNNVNNFVVPDRNQLVHHVYRDTDVVRNYPDNVSDFRFVIALCQIQKSVLQEEFSALKTLW